MLRFCKRKFFISSYISALLLCSSYVQAHVPETLSELEDITRLLSTKLSTSYPEPSLNKAPVIVRDLTHHIFNLIRTPNGQEFHRLFYQPDWQEWNTLYNRITSGGQASAIEIVKLLDETKAYLIEQYLNKSAVYTNDPYFYIPVFLDQTMSHIFAGCWGISDAPASPAVTGQLKGIFVRVVNTTLTYGGEGAAKKLDCLLDSYKQSNSQSAVVQSHLKVLQEYFTFTLYKFENPNMFPHRWYNEKACNYKSLQQCSAHTFQNLPYADSLKNIKFNKRRPPQEKQEIVSRLVSLSVPSKDYVEQRSSERSYQESSSLHVNKNSQEKFSSNEMGAAEPISSDNQASGVGNLNSSIPMNSVKTHSLLTSATSVLPLHTSLEGNTSPEHTVTSSTEKEIEEVADVHNEIIAKTLVPEPLIYSRSLLSTVPNAPPPPLFIVPVPLPQPISSITPSFSTDSQTSSSVVKIIPPFDNIDKGKEENSEVKASNLTPIFLSSFMDEDDSEIRESSDSDSEKSDDLFSSHAEESSVENEFNSSFESEDELISEEDGEALSPAQKDVNIVKIREISSLNLPSHSWIKEEKTQEITLNQDRIEVESKNVPPVAPPPPQLNGTSSSMLLNSPIVPPIESQKKKDWQKEAETKKMDNYLVASLEGRRTSMFGAAATKLMNVYNSQDESEESDGEDLFDMDEDIQKKRSKRLLAQAIKEEDLEERNDQIFTEEQRKNSSIFSKNPTFSSPPQDNQEVNHDGASRSDLLNSILGFNRDRLRKNAKEEVNVEEEEVIVIKRAEEGTFDCPIMRNIWKGANLVVIHEKYLTHEEDSDEVWDDQDEQKSERKVSTPHQSKNHKFDYTNATPVGSAMRSAFPMIWFTTLESEAFKEHFTQDKRIIIPLQEKKDYLVDLKNLVKEENLENFLKELLSIQKDLESQNCRVEYKLNLDENPHPAFTHGLNEDVLEKIFKMMKDKKSKFKLCFNGLEDLIEGRNPRLHDTIAKEKVNLLEGTKNRPVLQIECEG